MAGSPPQYALLIGISGSLAPETVKLGDVVISAHVKYYAPDKIKDIPHDNWKIISPEESSKICNPDHPEQVTHYRDGYSTLLDGRDKRFESSYYRYIRHSIVRDSEEYSIDKFMSMRKKIHGESCANGFSLFSGAVLGSNLVLDSKYYVDYLIEKNRCSDMDFYMLNSPEEFKERCKWDSSELLAVDMESYGFFTAFEDMKRISQGTHAIAVRGISDLASGKEDLDRETKGKHRHNATKRAVQVGIDYLQEQFQPSRFRLP